MSSILEARIGIVGIRPLLWHHFTVGAMTAPGERKQRGGVAGYDPDEWKSTVLYHEESRQLYILPTYVFGCFRWGARFSPKGRGNLMGTVGSSLQVLETTIPVNRYLPEEPASDDAEAEVYLDVRGVINPGSKARNVRTRVATVPGWECEFTIQWDGSQVSIQQMKKVAEDAGALVGVGDGRNIGMGRFEVKSFELRNGN